MAANRLALFETMPDPARLARVDGVNFVNFRWSSRAEEQLPSKSLRQPADGSAQPNPIDVTGFIPVTAPFRPLAPSLRTFAKIGGLGRHGSESRKPAPAQAGVDHLSHSDRVSAGFRSSRSAMPPAWQLRLLFDAAPLRAAA